MLSLPAIMIVLSAFGLPPSEARGQGSAKPAAERSSNGAESSGTVHLSAANPSKHFDLRGKVGVLKINNLGPAGLRVQNRLNQVTLGAGTTATLDFDSDTDLSVAASGADSSTKAMFEVVISKN